MDESANRWLFRCSRVRSECKLLFYPNSNMSFRNCLRKKPLGTIWSNSSLKLKGLRDCTSIISSLSIRKAPGKMRSTEFESTPTPNSMLLMEIRQMMSDLSEKHFILSRLNLISGLIRVLVETMTIRFCSESFLRTLFIL